MRNPNFPHTPSAHPGGRGKVRGDSGLMSELSRGTGQMGGGALGIHPRAKLHYKQAAAWGFCILFTQPASHCLLSSPVGGPAGTCGLESVKELVYVNTASSQQCSQASPARSSWLPFLFPTCSGKSLSVNWMGFLSGLR